MRCTPKSKFLLLSLCTDQIFNGLVIPFSSEGTSVSQVPKGEGPETYDPQWRVEPESGGGLSARANRNNATSVPEAQRVILRVRTSAQPAKTAPGVRAT